MALKAVGHKIIVKPDQVAKEHEVKGTNIKLHLAVDEKLYQGAQVKGTLVDVGPSAWKAFGKDFEGEPWAKVGDQVYYSKYAGKSIEDPEDVDTLYLVMLDEDVNALVVSGG